MITSPSPLQLDFLESVSLVFAGHAWERTDLARLTASAGSGLVSPAQDLLRALQALSDLNFGAVAIPQRSLYCFCEPK